MAAKKKSVKRKTATPKAAPSSDVITPQPVNGANDLGKPREPQRGPDLG